MDFSEISKWKNLTKNWMLFMKNSSENTVLDESWKVGSTSFRFKEIVCLLEPEYIKFLKLCLSVDVCRISYNIGIELSFPSTITHYLSRSIIVIIIQN